MELHLKFIGIALSLLALLHVIFPRYFNWESELQSLSLINRQMMHVHTFFIALSVWMMGLLCFSGANELTTTPFGRNISLGLAIFWGLRWFFQLFVYSSKLWRGKLFETTIHIAFSLFWAYMTWVFVWVYLG